MALAKEMNIARKTADHLLQNSRCNKRNVLGIIVVVLYHDLEREVRRSGRDKIIERRKYAASTSMNRSVRFLTMICS